VVIVYAFRFPELRKVETLELQPPPEVETP
jgi:hypothetical protein